VGYFGVGWIATQGFYGIMLPGLLLGLGAGWFRCRYLWPSIVCGVLALVFGLAAEWRFFNAGDTLPVFLSEVHKLGNVTLLMLAAGTLVGFWGPFSRYRQDRPVAQASQAPASANTPEQPNP
jgi:hypothetical protein